MNKLLIFRLIFTLIFWTITFFPGLFVPRILQYNTLWPIFSKLFLNAAKIRVKYVGKIDLKKIKNVIIVANHRSFADTFVVTGLLRKPFTITFIMWMTKFPLFKLLMNKMSLIPIPKNNLLKQKESIEKTIKILEKNYSVIYFPEGRFVHDEPIGQLKKGIVKIAKESGCAIMPISIYGTGIKKDFLFDKKLVWKDVYVNSAEPVKYTDYNDDNILLKELTSTMRNLYIDLERNFSPNMQV